MPPRKKAAAKTAAADAPADGAIDGAPAVARATRSSARIRARSASVDPPSAVPPALPAKPASKARSAPKAKPASKAKAPASKTNGKGKKRARDDTKEEEEEEEVDGEPANKKAKADMAAIDEEEEEEPEPPKKMVTVIKRGAAPVDPHSALVDTHQVYSNEEGIWDAMLNQTNVGKNANKFYVLQLLHPIGNPSSCFLFTRWGRVGEGGQQQKKGPFAPAAGVSAFKAQFRSKTATAWEQRHGMVAKSGKYQWLERSFEDDKDDDKAGPSKAKAEEVEEEIPDCQLAPEIQDLCRLIFSTKLMDAHLSSMNYDANKLPLGKLAKSTILNGFAALKELSEVLGDPNSNTARTYGGIRGAVEELTGRYYSIIPHVFGRNRPPLIDDMNTLKRELDLVDALGDMEVASKLIASSVGKDENGRPLNPMDAHFRSLRLTSMQPVTRKTKEFSTLETYVRDTHGYTHHMSIEVLNAFRVEREEETRSWNEAGHNRLRDGERLLLWHGSRTTNFAGILKQGLRIAPPEAPATGYMFGKGVYFADMMSKSANYCYAHLSNNTGLLLLCEVAAQPFFEQTDANYNADQACKGAGARATKGLGRSQPGAWQDAGAALDNGDLNGVHMPKGPAKDVRLNGVSLQYNEYIVYNTSQIRLRYLLMVKMG